MSRLTPVNPDDLDPEERAIWDRVAAVRSMRGPTAVVARIPALLGRVEGMTDYFREDATLPSPDRELAILVVAREAEAGYAWARHEPQARSAGVSEAAIAVVRAKGEPRDLSPREATIMDVTRSLLHEFTLPEALFARALGDLGARHLVELVTLVGTYTMIGLIIRGFEVPTPQEGPFF